MSEKVRTNEKCKIAVLTGKNRQILVEKTLMAFGGINSFIKKGDIVFIKLDLSFPESYPVTFDPDFLKIIINLCLKANPKKIYIGGVPLFGISSEYVWNSLGFANYFENNYNDDEGNNKNYNKDNNKDNNKNKNSNIVEFIALECELVEKKTINLENRTIMYPKLILDSDVYISMVNPKLNPVYGMDLCISNSFSLLSQSNKKATKIVVDNEDYCISDKYLKDLCRLMADIYLVKPPNLVFMDFSTIMSSGGPMFYSDTEMINSNITVISDCGVIAEMVGTEICKLNGKDCPLIKGIKEYNNSLTDREKIEQFLLIRQNKDGNDDIETVEIKVPYLEKHGILIEEEEKIQEQEETSKTSFLSKILKKSKKDEKRIIIDEELLPFIENVKNIPTLEKICPKWVNVCCGDICSGCKYAAMQLLLFLKSTLIKDAENFNEFSLLIGNNPENPKNPENIIVFGDCAIKSTDNYDFRTVKIKKVSKSKEEMELESVKYQAEIRERIIEWEEKKELISQNIKASIKDKKKLEKKLKSLGNKDKSYREKMDKKYSSFIDKLRKRQKREMEKKQTMKIKPNKSILEIPGCPPDGFEYFNKLIRFFKRKWVPTLNFYNQCINLFYERKFYNEYYRKFLKEIKEKRREK
ncbi:MAG: DUF362 domain-containing protein [Promethearchaeota archaeon]